MNCLRLAFVALFLPMVPVAGVAQKSPVPPILWAHETSDVPADPAVIWGNLGNGGRFAILPNQTPKGRVAVRLVVQAGSLHEADGEQGLARFVSRMGWRGMTGFTADQLQEFAVKAGMKSGADANVRNEFDLTTFGLEVPAGDPAMLEKALRVCRGFADGMVFPPDQVEEERSALLAANSRSSNVEQRAAEEQYRFLLPDALAPRRFPAGSEAVVKAATRDQLLAFYRTWYRPERIIVIVVGPVDAVKTTMEIGAVFGDLHAEGPAKPEPDRGRVEPLTGTLACLHSDPSDYRVRMWIQNVVPYSFEPDSVANRKKYLPRELAYAMLNRRFAPKKRAESGSRIVAGTMEFLDCARISAITTGSADLMGWRDAMGKAEKGLRQAIEHGFLPAEFREAVANTRKGSAELVKKADVRISSDLADELAQTVSRNRVFAHPSATAEMIEDSLKAITVADCSAALREAWAGSSRAVFVAGKLTLSQPEAEILAAYRQSAATAVEAPPRVDVPIWPYTDFGPAGRIVRQAEIGDLGTTTVEFENGVRLNIKRTGFEKGSAQVHCRVGGGLLSLRKDQPGLQAFAMTAVDKAGLGKLTEEELRQVALDRSTGLKFTCANDAFVFSGQTSAKDLEFALQWMAAGLTDPGFREEAMNAARKAVEEVHIQLPHKPEGLRLLEIERALAGGDSRFGIPDRGSMPFHKLEDLRSWLLPELTHGAVEIALVGDIDPATAIGVAARTVGALPSRHPRPTYADERRVTFPAQGSETSRDVTTVEERGVVSVHWPSTDGMNAANVRRLSLLAAIFGERLRARLERDLPRAGNSSVTSNASDTFPGFGYLRVRLDAAESAMTPALAAVREIAEELRRHGVSADELGRARQAALDVRAAALVSNVHWAAMVLSEAQTRPEKLDWHRTQADGLTAVTPAEVSECAALHLLREREVSFLARAVPFPKP